MKSFLRDVLDQLWTLLGMFVAWIVLDGSARTVVGYAILWSCIIWVVTYKLRTQDSETE
jgi:hypothetical protein